MVYSIINQLLLFYISVVYNLNIPDTNVEIIRVDADAHGVMADAQM